jgi:hypothetical protein
MTVDRTHNLNDQTRYELRRDTGLAKCPKCPKCQRLVPSGPDASA